ncbi:hypothetical protein Sjap_018703 [Stephania japonica]|uniref:Bifunctional inhibitor/plant lipid transfer protein/seed storage helical domain-containing protein n=1 Tax=Stephania japonica TaxID=461633 RepID=A0AAP0I8Q5_9MAGN
MAKAWSALLTLMLTALLVSGEGPAAAPSPSADCTAIVYDMIDCLSYIEAGSDEAKPSAECCIGVKSVLRTEAECLCTALNGAIELGIQLDVTRALGLPLHCGQTTPPDLNNCGLSASDAPSPSPASPVSPPEQSPPSDSTSIPSPPPSNDVGDGDKSPPSDSTSIPSPPPSDDDGNNNDNEETSNAPAPSPSAAYIITSANAFILLSALIFTILCF